MDLQVTAGANCPGAKRRSGPLAVGFRGLNAAGGPLLHSRRPARETMNDVGKASAYVALFSEIAFVLLIAVLAGVLGGYWLDQRLGTVQSSRSLGSRSGASVQPSPVGGSSPSSWPKWTKTTRNDAAPSRAAG